MLGQQTQTLLGRMLPYTPRKMSCLLQEITSQCWKLRLFLFNIGCCLAAAYFFRRHNKFCEAGGEHEGPNHQPSSHAEATLDSTICKQLIDCIWFNELIYSGWFLFILTIPQFTRSLHSLSTSWSVPTWPFTWQPSGTLETKRWS